MGCTNCGKTNVNCTCECPPGEKGADGASFAIISSVEPAGANCPFGGMKLQGGPDLNKDGIPDSILFTRYICNGQNGLSRAIKMEAEPAGANCANGGVKVTSGEDNDNDGVPDTNLVVSYVCNGGNGAAGTSPSLVVGTVTTLAPGAAATANVVHVGGSVYRVDLGIPTGAAGPIGGNTTASITIDGVTVPACLSSDLGAVTDFNQFLEIVLNKICTMATSASLDPSGYRATKTTSQQFVPSAVPASLIIAFEDDALLGNYDNGNNFHGTKFIASEAMVRNFIVQGLKIEVDGASLATGKGYELKIIKNGSTVLATSGVITGATTTYDIYGNQLNAAGSVYIFSPVIITDVVLAENDEITAVLEMTLGSSHIDITEGIFSSSL